MSESQTTVSGSQPLPEHLQALYDDTCSRENLSEAARAGLRALLCKHSHLFAESDDDLGRTHLVQHGIQTGEAAPIRQPPRRVPEAQREIMEEEVAKMLRQGVVEPGQSPWATPVVLVKKKDGFTRFCVDYRRLNTMTQFDAYPLPRIDETIDNLVGSKFFTTLDLLSGYSAVQSEKGVSFRAIKNFHFEKNKKMYFGVFLKHYLRCIALNHMKF